MILSKSCIICAAYPGHSGSHYSARDVTTRLFALRVRPSTDRRWTVLPGCASSAGRPIMASAHMPDMPDAVPVGPCWLCEQTADYREELVAAAGAEAAGKGAPAAGAHAAAPPAPEREAAAPPPATPQAEPAGALSAPGSDHKGEKKMATDGTKGYLHWLTSGLEVDIRADTNGNGHGAPAVEALKAALRDFHPPENTRVTLTETLGTGQAWVSVAAAPGAQGSLLVCTGQIMERLVAGSVYGEVAVNA
jgi:hypothetical protein